MVVVVGGLVMIERKVMMDAITMFGSYYLQISCGQHAGGDAVKNWCQPLFAFMKLTARYGKTLFDFVKNLSQDMGSHFL